MNEKLHIIPHVHAVNRAQREGQNGHRGHVVWFTGLSGSGKSTLANALEVRLHNEGVKTYLLDGDNIRAGLNKDLDFSENGRIENIRRIGEVAKLMYDAGLVVLTAFVSPFQEDRDLVRSLLGAQNFSEVFVSCPLEVCESRDVKGLYAKARAGQIQNFTGVSSPFEEPVTPEITVHTHQISIDEAVELIHAYVYPRILIAA